MEIGHLTDVLPHLFSLAANHSDSISPSIASALQDVWIGLREPDAMPATDKSMQIAKIAVATLGLSVSISNINIEGIAACSLMEGEALMEIAKRGHSWRVSHEQPPTLH